MLYPVYMALAIAFLFYLAIPIAGAFSARNQWRRFRQRVLEISFFPILRYRDIPTVPGSGARQFRLYGKVEAMVGKERIWVRGRSVSALIDFSRAPIYVLEAGETRAGAIERLPWKRVSSLGEGTKILVGGRLTFEDHQAVFVDDPEEALLVVSYDRDDDGLIADLIASGRPANEYWNSATRISFAIGMTLSSIFLVYLVARDLFPSVRALAFLAAMTPVLALSPPGLGFFLLYRYLWRRALLFRMERDLVGLPLRYFTQGGFDRKAMEARIPLPGGGSYVLKRLPRGGSNLPSGAIRGIGAQDESTAEWVIFAPEGSEDPAAETVIVAGDPETLARAADRKAMLIVFAAALAFGAAVVLNYVLSFVVWRMML